MSDDLVARLREGCVLLPKRWSGDTGADRPYGLLDEEETDGLMRAAADRIEQLEAERATLAEIVRLLDVSVEPCEEGETAWWLVTDNWFDYSLTPERAERFQRVLDRISETVSDE